MKYFILFITFLFSSNILAESNDVFYLKLKNHLDRPVDGYCLDVAGNGRYVRFDMPLNGHNCKIDNGYVYPDETVQFRKDGTIFFPAYELCVTVMGLNNNALEYNSLMVKPCYQNTPFLEATNFQYFYFNDKNQIQLKNSELCITMGYTSKTTYSKAHTWRSLYMQKCDKANIERSTWYLDKKN